MTRILLPLATLSIGMVFAAMWIGLTIGDLYTESPTNETLDWASLHRITGLAAAISVIFVESIIVTYFVGTSRWCKEVVETYQLDIKLAKHCTRLKHKTFPWALSGMLAVVGMSALGAASDPATGRHGTEWWTNIHLAGTLLGVCYLCWTYYLAWNNIQKNQGVISAIIAEVEKIRAERGLEPSEKS